MPSYVWLRKLKMHKSMSFVSYSHQDGWRKFAPINVLLCSHLRKQTFSQVVAEGKAQKERFSLVVYQIKSALSFFSQHSHAHLHKYTQTRLPTHAHKDNGAAAFLHRCLLCFVSKFNCNRNSNCNFCCTRARRQRTHAHTHTHTHTHLQCRQLLFLLVHLSSLAAVRANTQRHTCLSGNWRHIMQSYPASLLYLFIFFPPHFGFMFDDQAAVLTQSKHVFLGRSFEADRCQMCFRKLWAARFQAQLNRTRARVHTMGEHTIPRAFEDVTCVDVSALRGGKKHLCNRNQETRTSRDPSWQLSYNGGRLTAIVTKACTKFICFMTRQALPLFQRNYLDDLCVPAGQEMSLKNNPAGFGLFP